MALSVGRAPILLCDACSISVETGTPNSVVSQGFGVLIPIVAYAPPDPQNLHPSDTSQDRTLVSRCA